ncbi:hypothetical protein HK099_001548, partial [Clydaea vesicula]
IKQIELVDSFDSVLDKKMSRSSKLIFDLFISLSPDTALGFSSLSFLIKKLFKIYEQRVIVLVDEYDSPLSHAFQNRFYDKASSFF